MMGTESREYLSVSPLTTEISFSLLKKFGLSGSMTCFAQQHVEKSRAELRSMFSEKNAVNWFTSRQSTEATRLCSLGQ